MKTTHLLAFASVSLLTMSFSCDKQEAEEITPCDGATTSVQSQNFALPLLWLHGPAWRSENVRA